MQPADELRLQVEHPYFRCLEDALHKALFKWNHMPVDMVVEPAISILRVCENTGYSIRTQETIARTDADNDIVSHSYVHLPQEPDGADKIEDMRIVYDEAASVRYY